MQSGLTSVEERQSMHFGILYGCEDIVLLTLMRRYDSIFFFLSFFFFLSKTIGFQWGNHRLNAIGLLNLMLRCLLRLLFFSIKHLLRNRFQWKWGCTCLLHLNGWLWLFFLTFIFIYCTNLSLTDSNLELFCSFLDCMPPLFLYTL